MVTRLECTRCVFFFQAEDGIRDGTVTGVQTCALPIFRVGDLVEVIPAHVCPTVNLAERLVCTRQGRVVDTWAVRSEERRVGKECRSRWASYSKQTDSEAKWR